MFKVYQVSNLNGFRKKSLWAFCFGFLFSLVFLAISRLYQPDLRDFFDTLRKDDAVVIGFFWILLAQVPLILLLVGLGGLATAYFNFLRILTTKSGFGIPFVPWGTSWSLIGFIRNSELAKNPEGKAREILEEWQEYKIQKSQHEKNPVLQSLAELRLRFPTECQESKRIRKLISHSKIIPRDELVRQFYQLQERAGQIVAEDVPLAKTENGRDKKLEDLDKKLQGLLAESEDINPEVLRKYGEAQKSSGKTKRKLLVKAIDLQKEFLKSQNSN